MAVDAVREFRHHFIWMRNTVTVLTGGNETMFVLMAENALELGMLGCTGSERCLKFVVAGTAVRVGDLIVIGDIEW